MRSIVRCTECGHIEWGTAYKAKEVYEVLLASAPGATSRMIANKTDRSLLSVLSSLSRLMKAGLVEREEGRHPARGGIMHRYYISERV